MRKGLLKGLLIIGMTMLFIGLNYGATLATVVSATASAVAGGNTAAMSCDKNTGTRWESPQADPQWIYWDLGSSQALSQIIIEWESASGGNYTIQGSTDAATWTVLATVANTVGMVDHLKITNNISGTFRYVKMNGTTRTTGYGYSIWEVYIYVGTPASSTPAVSSSSSIPSSSASPVSSSGGVVLATINSATASTIVGGNTAAMSFDNNLGTRWETPGADPQWIYWDLGSAKPLNKIVIDWEVAQASNYTIQGSTDAATWTTLATVLNSKQTDHNQITTALSGTYRYVKMNGTTRTTPWGYSIWEVYIYTGTSASSSSTIVSSTTSVPVSSSSSSAVVTSSSVISSSSIPVSSSSVGIVQATILSATASTVNGGNTAGYSCDKSTGTRWESAAADPQWIYWDLGANQQLNKITIDWEVAQASNYTIQGSTDAATWTTLATVLNSSIADHTQITTSISGNFRYVRMNGTTRTTVWGYSIWEVYIYVVGSATSSSFAAVSSVSSYAGAYEAQITSLINSMSQAEKISEVGGNSDGAHQNHTPDVHGIPGFWVSDGPHGVRGGTLWPTEVATACTWDIPLVQTYGFAFGKEFRQLGNNVGLSPMLNIVRDGRWGRASETYSEDPYLTGKLASAQIMGLQSAQVIATPKHYACNNIESNRGMFPVTISERTLREIYTYAFREVIQKSGPWSIMAAYNNVNTYPCTANKHLLTDILKTEWAYPSFVMSDWGAVYNEIQAANAGTDLKMPGPMVDLAAAVPGTVPQSRLDDMVRRILRAKYWAGMMNAGYNPTNYAGSINSPEHINLALTMARESIVLAKNTGNLLPLSKTATQKVAVVGMYAKQARWGAIGSAFMSPSAECLSPYDAIVRKVPSNITITEDYTTADKVIVVVGINDEGEGFDRANTGLVSNQNEYVAQVLAAKPNSTIVVYTGGSGCTAGTWSTAPAVVISFYPGQQGGNALADVLFGDVNPSGKLSVSFPNDDTQIPPFLGVTNYESAGEGRGYFYLDKHNYTPLFPFGHGLSYTTFQYSNLRVSPGSISKTGTVTVQADVKNTGSVAGSEVVQLYVQAVGSSVDRRVKDLRGFTRVAMNPGETKTVTFTLDAGDVSYFNESTSSWTAETLTYNVLVGSSSRDIRLTGSFSMQ